MALNYLITTRLTFYKILFCVDSKSVLMALKCWEEKVRNDCIFEITFLIHYITSKGTGVDLC